MSLTHGEFPVRNCPGHHTGRQPGFGNNLPAACMSDVPVLQLQTARGNAGQNSQLVALVNSLN